MKTTIRLSRFAPSPTGYLHAGHLWHLMVLWEWKRQTQGKVFLRFEDHDRQRSKQGFEEAILQDLEWLEFEPDLLPNGELFYRQSDRRARYELKAKELVEQGVAYACTCSKKDLLARSATPNEGEELPYDGYCREKLEVFQPGSHSLRIKIPDQRISFYDQWLGPQEQYPKKQCGDFVVVDRNTNFSYQFCSTMDDLELGVTDIIRGIDLLESTGRQLLLRSILGNEQTPTYYHHSLLYNHKQQKLSKRIYSESISSWRQKGTSAEQAKERVIKMAGISPSHFNFLK